MNAQKWRCKRNARSKFINIRVAVGADRLSKMVLHEVWKTNWKRHSSETSLAMDGPQAATIAQTFVSLWTKRLITRKRNGKFVNYVTVIFIEHECVRKKKTILCVFSETTLFVRCGWSFVLYIFYFILIFILLSSLPSSLTDSTRCQSYHVPSNSSWAYGWSHSVWLYRRPSNSALSKLKVEDSHAR